jgi:hypothetical protein
VEDGGVPSGRVNPPVGTDKAVEVIERVARLGLPRPSAVVRSQDRPELSGCKTCRSIDEGDRIEPARCSAFPLLPGSTPVNGLEDQPALPHSRSRPRIAPADAVQDFPGAAGPAVPGLPAVIARRDQAQSADRKPMGFVRACGVQQHAIPGVLGQGAPRPSPPAVFGGDDEALSPDGQSTAIAYVAHPLYVLGICVGDKAPGQAFIRGTGDGAVVADGDPRLR